MTDPCPLRGAVTLPATEPLRLLQITDTHLMAEPGGTLLNVDTDASLAAVVDLARERLPADALLITGDIAGDGADDAYHRLDRALAPLATPSFWLPGNHDEGGHTDPELAARFVRSVRFPHWDVVLLNTQVANEVGGHLDADELAALADAVASANDGGRHLLVALHHPLHPLGCDWLDAQRVGNADAFAALLAALAGEALVISGHVHQDSDLVSAGVRYLTTPSTCVQFMPGSRDFQADDRGPGFRWLELRADGSVATGIERVTDIHFPVDLASSGYL